MKHNPTFFGIAIYILTMITTCNQMMADVAPYYSIRPQGVDAARELVGWAHQVNLGKDKVDCSNYGSLSLTAEYAQSFRPDRIAHCLLGTSSCNNVCTGGVINISGSHVASRGAGDWLADNFYLPTDFQSTVQISPVIENVVIDLDFYFGLNRLAQGLFFRLNMPLNWTKWDLRFCETITNIGMNNYDPGYFNSYDVPFDDTIDFEGIGIERSKLLMSFGQFASGLAPQGVTNTGSITSTSALLDPLCYAKIAPRGRSVVRLAELTAIFGWNFVDNEYCRLGAGLLVRAPTGNKPQGVYLFEPISGNGGHWELGAHITTQVKLWHCQEKDQSLDFYADANITHLFNTRQTRTFDLKTKPLSRYMLAEKFMPTGPDLAGGPTGLTATVPTGQFANELTPIANISAQQVNVSVGVQGDMAAQFTFANGGFNLDFGYNIWGRSCEDIDFVSFKSTSTLCQANPSLCSSTSSCSSAPSCPSTPSCPSAASCSTNACANVTFAPNTWGIKGDAYVYGFGDIDAVTTPVPLSATESAATINAGTNFPTGVGYTSAGTLNPGIDNPQLAWDGVDGSALFSDPLLGTTGMGAQTNTSINPVFISPCDFADVSTRGVSHKVYMHMSYAWNSCKRFIPYIGFGGFGEFGTTGNCNLLASTATCLECSLSQWGVWAKGGVSF